MATVCPDCTEAVEILTERIRQLKQLSKQLRVALITGEGRDEALVVALQTIGKDGLPE